MKKITDEVYVNPEDVSAIEAYDEYRSASPSDTWSYPAGSVIVLKNGRKIYIKGIKSDQIMELLK